jgi:hypothetical protein
VRRFDSGVVSLFGTVCGTDLFAAAKMRSPGACIRAKIPAGLVVRPAVAEQRGGLLRARTTPNRHCNFENSFSMTPIFLAHQINVCILRWRDLSAGATERAMASYGGSDRN